MHGGKYKTNILGALKTQWKDRFSRILSLIGWLKYSTKRKY